MKLIAITSAKDIKVNAVLKAYEDKNIRVFGFKTEAPMAEQPIDTSTFPNIGLMGAILRINFLLEGNNPEFNASREKFNYILSMENSININDNTEVSNVALYDMRYHNFHTAKYPVRLTQSIATFIKAAILETPKDYKYRHYGYAITIGKMINRKYPKIPDSDWLSHYSSMDRTEQLIKSLRKLKF
jgi:hypothetical protein